MLFNVKFIREAAFNEEGTRLLVATGYRWVHLFSLHQDQEAQSVVVNPVASRLVPFGLWSGAYRFDENEPDEVQVGLLATGNGIKTAHVRFDIPEGPPIEGDPQELFETWQRKLALKFGTDGKIVPRWPVEAPQPSLR